MSADLDLDAVRYLANEADAEATFRLSSALRGDPAARRRFAELARLHGHLGEIGRRSAAGEIDPARLLAPELPPDDARFTPDAHRPARRWPTWGIAAAGLVLAVSCFALALVAARTNTLLPTVATIHGRVEVQRDGGMVTASTGLRLRAGDHLTVADGSSLEIVLSGGHCILAGGAEAEVEAADEVHRRLILGHGTIDADLTSRLPVVVRTSAATISVGDASAQIATERQGTVVAVSRGSVEVLGSDGQHRSIPAGGRWTGQAGTPTSAPVAAKD